MGRRSSIKPCPANAVFWPHNRPAEKRLTTGLPFAEPTPTERERMRAMAAEGANVVTIHWEFGCRYPQEVIRKIVA